MYFMLSILKIHTKLVDKKSIKLELILYLML